MAFGNSIQILRHCERSTRCRAHGKARPLERKNRHSHPWPATDVGWLRIGGGLVKSIGHNKSLAHPRLLESPRSFQVPAAGKPMTYPSGLMENLKCHEYNGKKFLSLEDFFSIKLINLHKFVFPPIKQGMPTVLKAN